MSKLTLHFQIGLAAWAESFVDRSGVTWLKMMDPGDAVPLPSRPNVKWIIRFWEEESVAKAEVLMGKDGARARLNRIAPELQKRPWLKENRFYLEHMNEPSNAGLLATPDSRRLLAEFTAEFTKILWQDYGIRSCAYCLGVGHPEPEHAYNLLAPGLEALSQYQGIWALHEYGWPDMQNGAGYYCLRYRQTVDALRAGGMTQIPPLVITECGLDKLLTGEVGGWQLINNDPNWYVNSQLAWYDSEIKKDAYVAAAFIFTATPELTWQSYGIREGDAEVLAKYIANDGGEEEPPVDDNRPRGIMVSEYDGNIDWQSVADLGYKFVHIRVSSGYTPEGVQAFYADTNFEKNWDGAGAVGLLRSAWHYVAPDVQRQAQYAKELLEDRVPELGFYAVFAENAIDGYRADKFMKAANYWFPYDVGVHSSREWIEPRMTYSWMYDPYGAFRNLCIDDRVSTDSPVLPSGWPEWEFWLSSCQEVVGGKVMCVSRYNGTEQELYDEYGGGPVPPPSEIIYKWYDGSQSTEADFKKEFGNFSIVQRPNAKYHITELRAATGYSTFRFQVLDSDGNPAIGEKLRYSWPDGSVLHDVKIDGWAEHPMGFGEYYFPSEGEIGPAWAEVEYENSDQIVGVGMIGETEHNHFDVVSREGDAPLPDKYTVSIDVIDPCGGAQILISPIGPYDPGTLITLDTFIPSGCKFVGYTGDIESIFSHVEFTITKNMVITATFATDGEPGNKEMALELLNEAIEKIEQAKLLIQEM